MQLQQFSAIKNKQPTSIDFNEKKHPARNSPMTFQVVPVHCGTCSILHLALQTKENLETLETEYGLL